MIFKHLFCNNYFDNLCI